MMDPLCDRLQRGIAFGIWLVAGSFALVSCMDRSYAQMGGSDGVGAPAFSDPSFRDKLYEAGGFAEREGRQGAIILSVSIEGNSSVSENFILSQMQSPQHPIRQFHQQQGRELGAFDEAVEIDNLLI